MPEVLRFSSHSGKDPVQISRTHKPPNGTGNILNGSIRREIVVATHSEGFMPQQVTTATGGDGTPATSPRPNRPRHTWSDVRKSGHIIDAEMGPKYQQYRPQRLGYRLIKPHPDADGSKFHRGHEIIVVTVEAGGNSAIVFEFVEKPFDAVTQFIRERTEHRRFDAIGFRPDVRVPALAGNFFAQRV